MVRYVNLNDFAKIPEMANGISFVKNSTFTIELKFSKACTLGKQHKVYSKELPINIIDKLVHIYADLFADENTLTGGGDY